MFACWIHNENLVCLGEKLRGHICDKIYDRYGPKTTSVLSKKSAKLATLRHVISCPIFFTTFPRMLPSLGRFECSRSQSWKEYFSLLFNVLMLDCSCSLKTLVSYFQTVPPYVSLFHLANPSPHLFSRLISSWTGSFASCSKILTSGRQFPSSN